MFDELKEPLLFSLSRSCVPNVETSLRSVPMLAGATLRLNGSEPRFAHVIRSGVVSTAIQLNGGSSSAICLSACGDLMEVHYLLGASSPEYRITALVPGEVVRIPFAILKKAFAEDARFRSCALTTLSMHIVESEQLSACNGLHQLDARLARHLLTIQDRCGNSTIPLSQEMLAENLGVQRSSVAVAAGTMRRAGMIALRRCRIQILDRPGLEKVACECYREIRSVRSRLGEELAQLPRATGGGQVPLGEVA